MFEKALYEREKMKFTNLLHILYHATILSQHYLKTLKVDSVQSSSNTCKSYLLKVYSQHGNFLNAI